MRCSGRSLAIVRSWCVSTSDVSLLAGLYEVERTWASDERLRCAVGRTKTPLSSCVRCLPVENDSVSSPRLYFLPIVTIVFWRERIYRRRKLKREGLLSPMTFYFYSFFSLNKLVIHFVINAIVWKYRTKCMYTPAVSETVKTATDQNGDKCK